MSTTTFETQGFDRVEKALNKLSYPSEFFDGAFKKQARQTVRQLVQKTPKRTGNLAKKWSMPARIGPSYYEVTAISFTQDKKHNIMTLVDQGRGAVFPVKAKRLYIPLTNKAMAKPLGAKIPSGLVYGKDYVLAKKAKPSKPAKFIEPVVKNTAKQLIDDMIEAFNRLELGF